jgi:hypothetical protein
MTSRRATCAYKTCAPATTARRRPGSTASVRARPGRFSALNVFYSKSFLQGAFVWAQRALNSPKWRVPARAVHQAKLCIDCDSAHYLEKTGMKTGICHPNTCFSSSHTLDLTVTGGQYGRVSGTVAPDADIEGGQHAAVSLGLGRIVALHCRSSTLYQIC